MRTADHPARIVDRTTGCILTYRFEAHAGGVLRLTGGVLGEHVIAVGCDLDALNLVATLLLDGIHVRSGHHLDAPLALLSDEIVATPAARSMSSEARAVPSDEPLTAKRWVP